ncbi:MAG: pyridoxamine 5'-phosphate oxidase [Cellvibrionales bacterium]|nr:pyridoxamine 5'-phosphate oxidase [Cellvibrionales bacterium]
MSPDSNTRPAQHPPLRRTDLDPDPFAQFAIWYKQAEVKCQRYPNPIALATSTTDGRPLVRTVLLKGIDHRGFCFYSNYRSRKAAHLDANPAAAFCLYWEELERQIIVAGQVEKMSTAESAAYFATRPHGSQLGAHASPQSQPLPDRAALETRMQKLRKQYADRKVPCPPHWGGYRLVPDSVEFWQGQADRLHDRFLYRASPDGWTLTRLAP